MKIIPNYAPIWEDQAPHGYSNKLEHWGFFDRQDIEWEEGNLLMLDIDFGRYCSLNCPTCFRRDNQVDIGEGEDLDFETLLRVIDEARELGLESVKICGAGEPMQNPRFMDFVDAMTERDIGVAVFTKGQVLGSDEETERWNRSHGIETGLGLAEALLQRKASIMLGFQSFYTEIQDAVVGTSGHTLVRNSALDNLVEAGWIDKPHELRLALCNAPITHQTYDEAFDIYVFARQRNMYPVIALPMVSGLQFDKPFLRSVDITDQQKIELYTRIYSWNIAHGVQTLDQIQQEGVSAMPGAHPCNQVAVGLYVTANGNVVGCPGFTAVEGNVRTESIKGIWQRSQNRRLRSGSFNCRCAPKDGITIPHGLYETVLANLEERYG